MSEHSKKIEAATLRQMRDPGTLVRLPAADVLIVIAELSAAWAEAHRWELAYRGVLKGGEAERRGVKIGDFDPVQLARGAKHEREHTNDPRIAARIAMDHLVEDPDYYDKLAKAGL